MKKSRLVRKTVLRQSSKKSSSAPRRKTTKRRGPAPTDVAWERAEREAVLERDGWRCRCPGCGECYAPNDDGQGCVRTTGLQVDHVIELGMRVSGGRYNRDHPLNSRVNKLTLDVLCHAGKTENRTTWQEQWKQLSDGTVVAPDWLRPRVA